MTYEIEKPYDVAKYAEVKEANPLSSISYRTILFMSTLDKIHPITYEKGNNYDFVYIFVISDHSMLSKKLDILGKPLELSYP